MIAARRANRMARKHKRASRSVSINLVSLMDIFTILVFFLLVNSSGGEVLPTHSSIALPESVSEEIPRITVTIMVNEESILLHGKVVESVKTLLNSTDDSSESLVMALNNNKRRSLPANEATIMGDREIPYRLLKKVIASCTEAGFERISLAVLQVKSEAG
jgi:biopolymer transport protein TolR